MANIFGLPNIAGNTTTGHPDVVSANLGAAPSGYGSEYDRLFQNNPYRNLQYHETFWQKIASALGFRTGADKFLESQQTNAAEYDAGIFSMMQQNEYNSPESQAARMREAGINPDLQGLGDNVSAASPIEDPNGMVETSSMNEDIASFGSSIASVFTRALAMYKDFKGLGQLQNVIEAGNIENAKNFLSGIDDYLIGKFSAFDFQSPDNFQEAVSNLNAKLTEDRTLDWKMSIPYMLGYDKRQRNQFYDAYSSRLNSIVADKNLYQMFADRVSSMSLANKNRASGFYDDGTGLTASIDVLVSNLAELDREVSSLTAKLSKKTTENAQVSADIEGARLDYLDEMQGGVRSAQSELSDYDAKWYSNQFKIVADKARKKIMDELKAKADAGDHFAKVLLMNWTLDDLARLNLNASVSLGANFGLSSVSSVSDVTTHK